MNVHASVIPVVDDDTLNWIRDQWRPDVDANRRGPAFGFISVAFDYAVSHRPGCRFGPERILQALDETTTYCTDKRVSLTNVNFIRRNAVDIVHSLEQSYRNIRAAVASVPDGIQPVILGGDHSISDPAIRGVLDRKGTNAKIGLVVLDAHFDSRKSTKGKEHSGHWMRTISDVIDYRNVVQLGISAPIYSEQYMRSAENDGILVMTPYEIRKGGWPAAINRTIDHIDAGIDGVYLSIDIDSVDRVYAPGTSVPNPCGFLGHEVIDAVFEIASRVEVVGFDITEVSPPLDRDDATSKLAAQILLNFMAGVVRRQCPSDD